MDPTESETGEPWEPPNGVRRFGLKEFLNATEGFSKTYEIGFGGFGKVYKAQIDDGSIVAIKRASPSRIQGHKEFKNEITILSRLHHRCLVKLEGFCHEAGEQILVYEFMQNGNLNNFISGFSKTDEIGFGGFGKVYKAHIDDGSIVAIKRASPSRIQGHKEFKNEITILSRLHHRCLVKLEGFCHEAGEQVCLFAPYRNCAFSCYTIAPPNF
eukprot:Gb_08919 [translate_table: standard]